MIPLLGVIITAAAVTAWVSYMRRRGTDWGTASRIARIAMAFVALSLVGMVLTSVADGTLRSSYPTILFAAALLGIGLRFYYLMSKINRRS